MPDIGTIVNVTVTAQTKTVSRAGFGVPMILAYHTRWLDAYRIYTKSGFPSNMTDDGFVVSDPAYIAVLKLFSQSPSPTSVVLGRRLAAFTQTIEFIPTPVAENFIHKITIINSAGVSEDFTVTEGAGSTVALLCTAWETEINGGAQAVTATDGVTDVSVAADVAGAMFGYTDPTPSLDITDVTADAGIATDFTAVLAEYTDFYGVAIDSGAPAENQALAVAVEAQRMIFIAQEFDHDNGDGASTTDTAYVLKNSAYDRSAMIWAENALDFAGAAWLGACLPYDPGNITWAFKTLAGVGAGLPSATFETALLAKNGNSYQSTGGVNITYEGKTGDSYLDVTRTKDWAEARVKESVFGGLVNAPKIPFTNQGGSVIKGLVLAPLNQGVKPDDSGAFAADPAPYCIVPKVATILAADKTARNFTGIEWGATLSGAVHTVTIRGTLAV